MQNLVSYNTFYNSWHGAMDELTDEQYGKLARAINDYCFFGITPEFEGVLRMLFIAFKPNIDSSNKNKINGKNGSAPKGNSNAKKKQPPLLINNKPPFEKITSNEEENVNVDVKDNEKENTSGSSEPLPPDSESINLAELLLTSHRKEIPDYLSGKDTKKITEKWAEDIEKLIRIDKKPPETIRQVILWVKTPGSFWFPNIQSGKKLREKYETLVSQMQSRSNSDPPKKQAVSYIPNSEETDKWITELKESGKQSMSSELISKELKNIFRAREG